MFKLNCCDCICEWVHSFGFSCISGFNPYLCKFYIYKENWNYLPLLKVHEIYINQKMLSKEDILSDFKSKVDILLCIHIEQTFIARYLGSITIILAVSLQWLTLGWPTLGERRLKTRLIMMYQITHALIAIPNIILIPTRKSHNQTFRHITTQKDTYSTLQAQALV